jgi:outer membrane protein assembly factor BamB
MSEWKMNNVSTASAERRPRIWMPLILTMLCAAVMVLPTRVSEDFSETMMMVMFLGPMVIALLFLIWWLFFSRTSWLERFAAIGWSVAVVEAAALFSHPSMVTAMAMYMPLLILAGWTLALLAFGRSARARQVAIPLALFPAAALFMMGRFEGVTGEFNPEFSWRWTKKAEDEYLATRALTKPAAKAEPATGAVKPLELAAGDWAAFRGPNRDGVVRGVKIRTDWKATPPKQLWRGKIGPAWSSVAVVGDHVFTQEQRGPDEAVVCLSLKDGQEIWSHVDTVRFDEPVGGPGPRATPTFADGRLFTMGARGILNAFDAATGKRLWSHDLVKEYDVELKEELDPTSRKNPVPMWGFSSSPLVVGDKVAVYVGGKDKGVAVFNAADGKPVWTSGEGGHSYVSIHHAKLAGADMFLNVTNKGTQGLDPATGKVLWNQEWNVGDIVRCVQPAILAGDRVAIGTAFGKGTQIINVAKSGDGFTAKEASLFTSFKPYYSDFVMIDDAAYGFDGAIFGCFDLATGKRHWRGGRYGSGQVLLLADQNLLLVVTETDGQVVLLSADKSGQKELAKFKALTGKTWNHPVVAHGRLIVRNGEEIACFDVAEK